MWDGELKEESASCSARLVLLQLVPSKIGATPLAHLSHHQRWHEIPRCTTHQPHQPLVIIMIINENCWLVLGQLLITARKIKNPTNCTHTFGMMMMMLLLMMMRGMMMMMMMMMPRCLLKGMLHLLPVCLFKGGLSWKLRARREFVVGQTNQQFQDNTFRAATDSLPRIHSKAAADE